MAKTLAEKVAVMQACLAGATIQSKVLTPGVVTWNDCAGPNFNWVVYDYRVKPQPPRDIWVNEYEKGFGLAHPTEEVALFVAATSVPAVAKRTAIHFREVIGK